MAAMRTAFVLRIWREGRLTQQGGEPTLRGTLQSVDSGQVHAFQTLEGLTDLLSDWFQAGGAERPDPGPQNQT